MHRGGAGLGQSARGKAAGDMDRGPERTDALIQSGDVGLIGQIAGHAGDDLLVVAQPKTLRLRFVEARHMADRAGLDQRGDDRGAERAGAARDNDVTIAKVHLRSLHGDRIIADPEIEARRIGHAPEKLIVWEQGRISG